MRFSKPLPNWFFLPLAASFILAAHALLLFFFPEQGTLITDTITPLACTAASLGMLWAAWNLRARSTRQALAWGVLGAAQGFTALGDVLWFVYEVALQTTPSPSLADAAYLTYYPLFLAGVLLLPSREEKAYGWAKKVVDMMIVLLASVLVLWNYVLGPMVYLGSEDPLLNAINMAYPVGDLLLFVALLMLLYRPSGLRYKLPLWIVVAGTLLVISYDMLYAYLSVMGAYQTGHPIDLAYTFGNVLFGVAGVLMGLYALRQDVPFGEDLLVEDGRGYIWLIYLPYVWAAAAYLLVMVRDVESMPMNSYEINSFVGVIIGMVIFRQLIVLHENQLLSRDLRGALDQLSQQAVALELANQEMRTEIQERQRAEERLTYDALHDSLTGLPNRALFLDRLGQAGLKKKRHADLQYAVLFLDLDSFKVVNDSLGHITGDQLLVRTGRILQSCVRSTDTVARLGGDEFVILLEELTDPDDAIFTANRLQSELSRPIQLEGVRVDISVSIGIVHQVGDYNRPEDILRDADLAMYQAKSQGKARYVIFHDAMRESAITRMALESDLRRALESDEFVLYYQPILSLPNRRLVGFEALVRWRHPERGLVLPSEFIPVAEETGLILPLGRWILYEACRQARDWQVRFPDSSAMRVSVNISGKQLKQPDFVTIVAQALKDTHLDASRLSLEVTETVLLESLETIAGTLEALKALGVETQIDDFGTGYSSLAYLKRLPVRSIKIDRSFIQDITAEDSSELALFPGSKGIVGAIQPLGNGAMSNTPDLVRAIFTMVNDLGIKAVAEGIETELQLNELNRLRCSYVQGFYLAVPMDQAHVDAWMREQGV